MSKIYLIFSQNKSGGYFKILKYLFHYSDDYFKTFRYLFNHRGT